MPTNNEHPRQRNVPDMAPLGTRHQFDGLWPRGLKYPNVQQIDSVHCKKEIPYRKIPKYSMFFGKQPMTSLVPGDWLACACTTRRLLFADLGVGAPPSPSHHHTSTTCLQKECTPQRDPHSLLPQCAAPWHAKTITTPKYLQTHDPQPTCTLFGCGHVSPPLH